MRTSRWTTHGWANRPPHAGATHDLADPRLPAVELSETPGVRVGSWASSHSNPSGRGGRAAAVLDTVLRPPQRVPRRRQEGKIATKQVPVHFYEVVLFQSNGDEVRFAHWQWEEWLQKYPSRKREDRLVTSPRRRLLGIGHVTGGRQHLLLGELLNQDDLPWEEDDEEGVAQRAAVGDSMRLSLVRPIGESNIFALARLQSFAPGPDALEAYLNGLQVQVPGMGKGALVVRPVASRSEVEQLLQASGASRVVVTLGGSVTDVPHNSPARAVQAWSRDLSNFKVTMTIELSDDPTEEDKQQLLDEARALAGQDFAEQLRVALLRRDGEHERRARASFVIENITTSVSVPLGEAELVTPRGMAEKLPVAINRKLPELRKAVGGSP